MLLGVPQGYDEYATPFLMKGIKITSIVEDADIVLFPGGADVSPSLYGEPCGRYTSCNSHMDAWNEHMFKYACYRSVPMLGICRGAQFLTVMNGGKLVQHVENHCKPHVIDTTDFPSVWVSSTHHQMMYPYNLHADEYDILACTTLEQESPIHLDGNNEDIPHFGKEPEVVWYPKTRCLCIQAHPEIMDPNSGGVKYFQRLFKEYLL